MALLIRHRRPAGILLLAAIGIALGLLACRGEEAPAPTGENLFLQYCAACHGVDGAGAGPVAASLRVPPSDLTRIAERSDGRFDEARVMAVIDGRREVAAHGTREMPVWGAVFEEQQAGKFRGRWIGLLHSRALTDYIRSLQRR